MKNVNVKFAAALVCLLALIGFEHHRVSSLQTTQVSNKHLLGAVTPTDISGVKYTPSAHGSTHAGNGSDVIPNASESVAGLQSSADKTTTDQFFGGPRFGMYEAEEFFVSGSSTGSGTLCGATVSAPFSGNMGWRCTTSGTLSAVTDDVSAINSTHWGIVKLDTGNTTTGTSGISRAASSTPAMVLGAGQSLSEEWMVQLPTLSDGTNTFEFRSGWMQSPTNTVTDGCYATYSSAAPQSGKFICRTCAASSCTNATGGSASVVASTWYRVGVTYDGTNCACQVNGVSIGSTASTIPIAAVAENVGIIKSAGTTSGTALVDYYFGSRIIAGGR